MRSDSGTNTTTMRKWLRPLLAQPLLVHVLRCILCIVVYSVELASFWPYISRCRGRLSSEASHAPIQILILTDPQLITTDPHPSYKGFLARTFFPIVRTFTDRYLARAWRALRSPGAGIKGWTATVWLGDLTDTGREHYLQEGLPELYSRFHALFPQDRKINSWNSTFYLPGNHDVAMQPHPTWHDPPYNAYWILQTREYSRVKYLHDFGTSVWDLGWEASPIFPPTDLSHTLLKPPPDDGLTSHYTTKVDHKQRKSFSARVPIKVAHADGSPPSTVAELILLDATDVISLQRMGRSPHDHPAKDAGKPGSEADWRYGGVWWFIDSFASEPANPSVPRILFTHIPLHRDAAASTTSCRLPPVVTDFPPGVIPAEHPTLQRESSRPISQGTDAQGTYQNMIDPQWSEWIKSRIQPSVIFSGDDHDLCHHLHSSAGAAPSIPELTLNAFSLTSGVSTPGYARLSIWQEPPGVAGGAAGEGSTTTVAQTKLSYAPCALPPQIQAWAGIYPVTLALTAFIVFIRRVALTRRSGGGSVARPAWREGGAAKRNHGGGGGGGGGGAGAGDHPDIEDQAAGETVPLHVIGGEDDDDEEGDEAVDVDDAAAAITGSKRARRRSSSQSQQHPQRPRSRSRSPSRTGSKASPYTSPLNKLLSLPTTGQASTSQSYSRPRSRWRTLSAHFLRDLMAVVWVPALYWLLLWLFGF